MIIIEAKKRKPIIWNCLSEQVLPSLRVSDIISVEANDIEMDVILRNYHNLPHTTASSQIWVGEFAKQVFANLRQIFSQSADSNKDRPGIGLME